MTSGSAAGYVNPNFQQELNAWLTRELPKLSSNWDPHSLRLDALGGDAGFRRYFRLTLDAVSLLAVYAPPATENNEAFLKVGRFLSQHGIHVPKVLAQDLEQGFFLIEDLGESLYLDHLNDETVTALYGEALFALLRIQQASIDPEIFPAYDRERLLAEMTLLPDWFASQMLDHKLTGKERAMLDRSFDYLVDMALAQPQVVVHRDFHSRNIVYGVGGAPGIIDFQDAVAGPITYDLVSLLKDCYIQWPEEQVRSWALAYGNMARDANLIPAVSEEEFLTWFDLMGLQRHIKVLGIFARLSLRDGKDAYLNDLPMVVSYVRRLEGKYLELAEFYAWFEQTLMPKIRQQPWWREGE